jgi:hypothetical protein
LTEPADATSLVYIATLLLRCPSRLQNGALTRRNAETHVKRNEVVTKGLTLKLEEYSRLSSNKVLPFEFEVQVTLKLAVSQSSPVGVEPPPRFSSVLKITVLSSRDVTSDERRECHLSEVTVLAIFTKYCSYNFYMISVRKKKKLKTKGGVVRLTTFNVIITGGRGGREKFTALKVPRQCPLVLLIRRGLSTKFMYVIRNNSVCTSHKTPSQYYKYQPARPNASRCLLSESQEHVNTRKPLYCHI